MSTQELSDTDYEGYLKSNDLVVVDVFASWCGTCRMFAKSFDEVAAVNPDMSFAKIDGDINKDFASKIEIDNLPFIAVFKAGEYIGGKSTSKKEGLE